MSKILIIDDSPLLANLLRTTLEHEGYDVAVATDANQGFDAAVQKPPDLILLDVHLPDMLGFDLVKLLKQRERLAAIPIIIITGTHHATEHKVRAFQSGVDDYLTKPFEMPELVERVAAVLRRVPPQAAAPPSPVSFDAASVAPFEQASSSDHKSPLSLWKALLTALLAPDVFPADHALPPLALPYLLASNGLVLAGLMAASVTIKPLAAVLWANGLWGIAVSILVMMSSVLGIPLGWTEGARLFSLAAVPLLLRLLGGAVLALVTTLSPFLFSTGPALLVKSASGWMEAADLSVLWTVFLCGWLLNKRDPQKGRRHGWIVAGVLWVFFISAGMVAKRFA